MQPAKRYLSFLQQDSFHCFVIVIYLLLFCWQLNLYPGQRYPEWDNHWGDVRLMGRIVTIERALRNGELPAIDPYTSFGWNVSGDLFSPWGPLYLLGLVFPPPAVLWLFQVTFLSLAGIGTYYFLKRFIDDKFISLVGGMTYPTIWASTGGSMFFMHHGFIPALYFMPVSLILIHRVLERKSAGNLFLFALYFAFLYSSMDAFPLFIFPALVLAYTLVIAWFYYQRGFLNSLKKSLLLLFLSLLAGSIYLVPMYWNCFTDSAALDLIRQGLPEVIGERGRWHTSMSLFENIDYLGTLHKPPFEPSANAYYGATYVPIAFYLTIIAALGLFRMFFPDKPRLAVVVVALLLLFPLMLLVNILYWSDASKLIMSFRETASNIVSVPFNLNLLPYVVVLATFICFGVIAKSSNKALKLAVYGALVAISLLVDEKLFGGRDPWSPYFESSNRIRIPVEGSIIGAFIWINLLALAVMIVYDLLGKTRVGRSRNWVYPAFVLLAILMRFVTITVYNDWNVRCGAGGRMLTRHPHRWDNHFQREAEIDRLIDRSDPNYRYLYCGPESDHSRHDGRDWKTIGARELNVLAPHKMLFTRKNFTHPYTGMMRGLSVGGGFKPWQINPPLGRLVVDNIARSKRMLGIKYVLSVDEPLDSPHLNYIGRCDTGEFPRSFYVAPLPNLIEHWSEAGPIFIYEVADPTGIAFLVDEYKKIAAPEALRTIYENSGQPWDENMVYLETDPIEPATPHQAQQLPATAAASLVNESYTSIEVQVEAPDQKFLVLSYLHRPFWKATIGDLEVPIYRAYGGFMCVAAPAGEYTVRFRYTPYDVYLGMLLTVVSFVLPLGLCKS